MFIKIDNRETDVLTNMSLLFREHSHHIEVENIPLGDMILYDTDKNEKVIFERDN